MPDHVDVVLEQHRHAVQRPAQLARRALGIQAIGLGQRLRVHLDDRIEGWSALVDGGDAGQIGLGERARRERAGGHPISSLGGAELDDVDDGHRGHCRRRRGGCTPGEVNEQGKDGQGAHGHGRDGSGVVNGVGPIIADRRAGPWPGTMITVVAAPVAFALEPFVPRPVLAGGHRMTLYAWARRRHFPRLPPAEARFFRVADDTEVLGPLPLAARSHARADGRAAARPRGVE